MSTSLPTGGSFPGSPMLIGDFTLLPYKLNQSGQPAYLANFFLRRISSRPSRSGMKPLVVPKHDREALGNSFHISTTYIWNSLPSTIRDLPTLASFKTSLYNFIFNLEATSSFYKHVFKFQEAF